jgi:hypothetical protein
VQGWGRVHWSGSVDGWARGEGVAPGVVERSLAVSGR